MCFISLSPDESILTSDSVDIAVQQPMFPEFAFNNTYGIKAIDGGTYRGVKSRYNLETGCGSRLPPCVKLAADTDPENLGPVSGSGNVCNHAGTTCQSVYAGCTIESGVSMKGLPSKLAITYADAEKCHGCYS